MVQFRKIKNVYKYTNLENSKFVCFIGKFIKKS